MINIQGWHLPDNDKIFLKHLEKYPNTTYQQEAINEAFNHVKNFNNVIDIGANIGLHSVRFSSKFKKVFSFEPVSSNYECLEKNTETFENIERFKSGLGEDTKIETISIPKNSNNCGAYSIVDFVNYEDELVEEQIQIKKLDDFNLNADLIKIDAQGFEVPILKGSIDTLERCKPVLILEAEWKQDLRNMNELLDPLGYEMIKKIKHDTVWKHNENSSN